MPMLFPNHGRGHLLPAPTLGCWPGTEGQAGLLVTWVRANELLPLLMSLHLSQEVPNRPSQV